MAEFGFEIDEIAQLIAIAEANNLSELEVEDGELKVVIRGHHYRDRRSSPTHMVTAHPDFSNPRAIAPASGTLSSRTVTPPKPELPTNRISLTSPMVGVFYRASGPDSANFIEVGDQVEIGQTVGMIEAMKVFSEIPSESAGKVVGIPAQNNQLVRPGEPLIYLIPN